MKPLSNTRLSALAASALLLGLSACAGPDATEPLSPEPAQQQASLVCGRLDPGQSLGRGQSVQSCNGALNLVHQTDGNVVAYDSQGALWSTGTNGPTTSFVMQYDGNLVVYNGGTARWSSNTSNNPGAYLAIQDDCNLVIYKGSQVLWASYTFCRTPPPARIDPLAYMLNTSGQTMQDTRAGFGQMQRTLHDSAGKNFYYLKNPYEPHRWELYFYNDSKVWLYRDTTLPIGEGPGSAYEVEPWDAMWIPRSWAQGEERSFSATIRYFNHLNSPCPNLTQSTPWPHGRHMLRFVGRIDVGGALGEQDVIVVDRYHDVSVNHWNPRGAERFWYAKGLGWVRWEYWPDSLRNPDGSPRGNDGQVDRFEDSKFHSSNPADLKATSPLRRVMMNQRTGANPGLQGLTCR
ncbi:hypothetical protein [Pyxidicoccus xibeiensis]|uniref:hypothetical protein n=1 Tax=Pyxidicoccus xibeiensis TaxID=2906759 RepID=UPI0020A6DF81|nr:hypothetical protein [Pyxidicoccus xibeiensis]MCP3137173.1 hypothetical protein [Pyxidicoccus xibeiensis]